MIETLNTWSFVATDPTDASALSTLAHYQKVPIGMTIVYVTVGPLEDDAGATLDINDDGTGVITAVDASDKDVPGTWISTHFGGTNAPVTIAADSVVTFDFNSAAAGNAFMVTIWYLASE